MTESTAPVAMLRTGDFGGGLDVSTTAQTSPRPTIVGAKQYQEAHRHLYQDPLPGHQEQPWTLSAYSARPGSGRLLGKRPGDPEAHVVAPGAGGVAAAERGGNVTRTAGLKLLAF